MRIAVIGQDFPESFGIYVVDNLERMGHDARLFVSPSGLIYMGTRSDFVNRSVERVARLAFNYSQSVAESAERRMARNIHDWGSEMVISTDPHLWPATVRKLKDSGPVVVWFHDALVNLGRQLLFIAPYDRIFLKDPYLLRYFTEIERLPAAYLPEACDPTIHYPIEPAPDERDELAGGVAMVGNFPPNRVKVLEQLADFDLRLWGRRFPPWVDSPLVARFKGEYLAGEKKAKVMTGADIVLNNLHYAEIESSNRRLFEAAACSAFQAVEWRADIEKLFEGGTEVVFYRSITELRDLINHWLPLSDERRAIGKAAARRVLAEHTYEQRLSRLLEESI